MACQRFIIRDNSHALWRARLKTALPVERDRFSRC